MTTSSVVVAPSGEIGADLSGDEGSVEVTDQDIAEEVDRDLEAGQVAREAGLEEAPNKEEDDEPAG